MSSFEVTVKKDVNIPLLNKAQNSNLAEFQLLRTFATGFHGNK